MVRILVIDDDAHFRTSLCENLTDEGHDTLEASNGLEGTKVLASSKIDLVITDIIMPEKEGLATIREVHRDYPDTKIIAISEGGTIPAVDYLRTAKLFGAHHTLAKPFRWEDMKQAVSEVLEKEAPKT
jgi:DNA-binding NtrC family response regulator